MSGIKLIKASLAGMIGMLLLVSATSAKQLTPPLYWEPGHVPYKGTLLAAPYLTEGLKHWTEGNNIQKLLTRIGQHNDWPNLATIWPRGSGNAHEGTPLLGTAVEIANSTTTVTPVSQDQPGRLPRFGRKWCSWLSLRTHY